MKPNLTHIIIFINVILTATQFWLASSRAPDGEKLARINERLELVTTLNRDLKMAILHASSISEVENRAASFRLSPLTFQTWSPLPVAQVP